MVYCEKSRVSPLEPDAKRFDTADFFFKFHDLPLESREERRFLMHFMRTFGGNPRRFGSNFDAPPLANFDVAQ